MATGKRLTSKSVVILKLISEGHSYNQIVDGQKGITSTDVFRAAEEALELNESKSDYTKRMESIKERYPSAYERWTDKDDADLIKMYRQGKIRKEMAERFHGQPSAITARLAKLGFTDRFEN